MNGVEYVRRYCKMLGVPISKLERDLGFANGYFNPNKLQRIPYDRAVMIAEYLGADVSRILETDIEPPKVKQQHYIDDDTASMAEELYRNKELRALFKAARGSSAEDLKLAHDMLLALKRKERGE